MSLYQRTYFNVYGDKYEWYQYLLDRIAFNMWGKFYTRSVAEHKLGQPIFPELYFFIWENMNA